MRGQWAETLVGLVVLGLAAAFLVYGLSVGGIGRAPGGYGLSAKFGDVGGLAAGADVSVAGVKVGTVERVSLDPQTFLAKVAMRIDAGVMLPADSTAKITTDGLLGETRVAIGAGGASENLKPGGEIENTQGAVDLFGLIGQAVRPAPPADAN